MVNDLMSVKYVKGRQTTFNEVYIAYLNQVNIGAIEIYSHNGVLVRDISEY